jgi:hypothetical protein
LKDAITKGEVDVDESEAEEEKGEGLGEEKKGEEHVHHRVSFVCFFFSMCCVIAVGGEAGVVGLIVISYSYICI